MDIGISRCVALVIVSIGYIVKEAWCIHNYNSNILVQ